MSKSMKGHIDRALEIIARRNRLADNGQGEMQSFEYDAIATELVALRERLGFEVAPLKPQAPKPKPQGSFKSQTPIRAILLMLAVACTAGNFLSAFLPEAAAGTKAKVTAAAAMPAKTLAAATPLVIPQNFTVEIIDTVNDASALTSHIIKWGAVSGNYPAGNSFTIAEPAMTHDFVNFAAGRWYVALTAKNRAGVESPPSSEAVIDVLATPAAPGGIKFTPAPGLVNVSMRAKVGTGDDVLIGGFILNTPQRVIVRGLGPSLLDAGLPDALKTTSLELHDNKGKLLKSNKGWKAGPDAAEITKAALAPGSPNDSALIATLPKGAYTAILRGLGTQTGLGLVDAYPIQ